MYPNTKYGIPNSKNRRYAPDTIFLEPRPGVKVTVSQNSMPHSEITRSIHTPNLGFLPQIIQAICSRHDISRTQARGQGDQKTVCDTPQPQGVSFTHQIWDSYLKLYRRYALDTIFLELRLGVKVAVTRKHYTTLRDPKVYQHTKYGIPTSNYLGNMLWTWFGRTHGRTVQWLYMPPKSTLGT